MKTDRVLNRMWGGAKRAARKTFVGGACVDSALAHAKAIAVVRAAKPDWPAASVIAFAWDAVLAARN